MALGFLGEMRCKCRGEWNVMALEKLTGKKLRAPRERSARATAAAACQTAGDLRKPWRPRRGVSGREAARERRKRRVEGAKQEVER
jgi:hypothetical protein